MFGAALAGGGIALALTRAMVAGRIATPWSVPSERSLHSSPVPRGGGLGIAGGILFAFAVGSAPLAIIAALALVWAVSAWDDWSDASPILRLSAHAVAVALVVAVWAPTELPIYVVVLLAFAAIWFVNVVNFIDGADGVAATVVAMAAGGFAGMAMLANATQSPSSTFGFALAVAFAALGFLPFNLPPARIFMGDGGSIVLGLATAAVALKGMQDGAWPLAVPLIMLMPAWADATYTLARRMLTGHSPLRAHRDHLYQRLALAGLGHPGVLWWITGWMLFSQGIAWMARALPLAQGLNVALALASFYVLLTEWTLRRQPNLLINPRAFLALLYDVMAAAVSWAMLFWARFNFNIDSAEFAASDVLHSLAFVIPVHALVFVAFGLYQGLWRFASMPDLRRLVLGAFAAAAATAVVLAIVRPAHFIWPRSVLLLQPFLLIVLMGGARFAYRSWREHRLYGFAAAHGEPVVVLGAGETGAHLVSELTRSRAWHVVALLDDDHAKIGARVHGAPVVGRLHDVGSVARRFAARHAIIAMPHVHHEIRRRAVELATAAQLKVLTVPSWEELLGDGASLGKLRAIELEDLLGRDPVKLDSAGLKDWIEGRTVLVTGAGGSIGTELCKQLARFQPARLIAVDLSEFAAHQIGEQLATRLQRTRIELYVADARSAGRMAEIFERERPSIVFHAAAYKHVPLTEGVNAWEAIRNNVLGTLVVARAAAHAGVEKFVLISTDKAVRPSSIMGASKRLAELAIMSLPQDTTRYVAVRFGNVLGSNGSVIPKFREQIASGGPLTVTHPEMTRYFMSIPEAAQLVLQAGLIGEPHSVYILDMGEAVRIVDLARELIRMATGDAARIPIVFTGLRPGEKMHEELTGDGEHFVETGHDKLRRVIRDDGNAIDLDRLRSWLDQPPPDDVRRALKAWVEDFNPPEPSPAPHTSRPH